MLSRPRGVSHHRRCYLYRMLVSGSIEEKVFERQLSKEGLSGIATNEQVESSTMSSEELRDLFTLHEDCASHLHLKIREEQRRAEASSDDEGEEEVSAAPRKGAH